MDEKYNTREYDFDPKIIDEIHKGKTIEEINKEIEEFEKNFWNNQSNSTK